MPHFISPATQPCNIRRSSARNIAGTLYVARHASSTRWLPLRTAFCPRNIQRNMLRAASRQCNPSHTSRATAHPNPRTFVSALQVPVSPRLRVSASPSPCLPLSPSRSLALVPGFRYPQSALDSTAFGSEAQARRELAEVRYPSEPAHLLPQSSPNPFPPQHIAHRGYPHGEPAHLLLIHNRSRPHPLAPSPPRPLPPSVFPPSALPRYNPPPRCPPNCC